MTAAIADKVDMKIWFQSEFIVFLIQYRSLQSVQWKNSISFAIFILSNHSISSYAEIRGDLSFVTCHDLFTVIYARN